MNNLVRYTRAPMASFEPQSFGELMSFSEIMARSEMVPKDFRGKPANIVTAVIAGREIGLSAYQSLQSYAVINGRAALWGDAVMALIRARPDICEYIKERAEGAGEDRKAICVAKRRDQEEEIVGEFSVVDARVAGLWNKEGPWRTYPERMLKMRARSFCLRDAFADVLRGTVMVEEVQDYNDPVNVTASAIPTAPVSDSRTAQVRSLLAERDVPTEPATPPEAVPVVPVVPVVGVVEAPLPNVDMMLSEQIREVVEDEAHAVSMPIEILRDIIARVAAGGKLSRKSAHAVIAEIRKWTPPAPTQPMLLDGAAVAAGETE